MKLAASLTAPAGSAQPSWQENVEFAQRAEALDVDSIWSAEAWIWDAVTPLAYLAAVTRRIGLGAGILQVTGRAPGVTAMTALSLNKMSGGRFLLGLGASGPKVVEGLHGIPFARPVTRLRETIEVLRLAFAGEPVVYQGRTLRLPLSGDPRDAMTLGLAPAPEIPIYVGSLSPASLRMTGELADGWLGQVFVPEGAKSFLEPLREGAAAAGRSPDAIDVVAGGVVRFGEDLDALVEDGRRSLAFTLGAMGTGDKNFYVDAYARSGYADVAREVQALWRSGDRRGATAAVPDELVLRTHLLGDDASVAARVRAYRDAGVTTLRISPQADSHTDRLASLERIVDIASAVD